MELKIMTEMRETGAGQVGLPRQRGRTAYPEPTAWVGWLFFASIMLILEGTFQAIAGLVALFNNAYFAVREAGLVVSVSYATWGWVHLIVGVTVVLAGFGILTGQTWARVVGVVLAGLSAIVNIAFLAANPVWSVLMIALDVVVIYALCVHGREMHPT
jgi:hypothetical protein